MSSGYKDLELSRHDLSETIRLAIVVSRPSPEFMHALCNGAFAWLAENGVGRDQKNIFTAPGAFELPIIANALARSGHYDGVICLGCVPKDGTANFEFVSFWDSRGVYH